MEKTLIKAVFHKKNKSARLILILSIIIMIVSLIMGAISFINASNQYYTGGKTEYYTQSPIYYNGYKIRDSYSYTEYVYNSDRFDSFFDYFSSYHYDKTLFYYSLMLLGIGIIGMIFQGVARRKKNHCELTVTNMRILGKTSFGKSVNLPLQQITAVKLGSSDRISISTASGTIHFWLLQNRDAVYKIFTAIVAQLQSGNYKHTTSESSAANELKQYKDLFDSGVISQEDFEAKKKQLLNL